MRLGRRGNNPNRRSRSRRGGCSRRNRWSRRGARRGSHHRRSISDSPGPRRKRRSCGRTGNHRAQRRSAGNRGSLRGSDDVRALPRQGNDPARSRSRCGRNLSTWSGGGRNRHSRRSRPNLRRSRDGTRCGSRSHHGRTCGRSRRYTGRANRWRCRRHPAHARSWGNHRPPSGRRRGLYRRLSLPALQNRAHRIARLRRFGQIDLRHRRLLPAQSTLRSASAVDVVAHPLGLLGLDRARVRLSCHADRLQSVQNGSALDLQLPRQIINSNFAHPSLFACPAPLAGHSSLMVRSIYCT